MSQTTGIHPDTVFGTALRRACGASCIRLLPNRFTTLVTYSHKKYGTISSLHYDVENLAVTEVIHTGSFCLGDEAMQLDEEEDVD